MNGAATRGGGTGSRDEAPRTEADPVARVELAERVLRAAGHLRLKTSFPLAPLTSFRLGGPAALYLEAEREADLAVAAAAVATSGIPWIVLGKGSNILVSDRGFPGLVIRLGRGYRWAARDGTTIHAGGSMPLPALAGVALTNHLTGLEFGVAIPASLGGAVRMNAGAHGHSMQDALRDIDLYSIPESAPSTMLAADASFAYRRSSLPTGSIVVGASIHLAVGEPDAIRREMEAARSWRRATQPLAEPNCGSVFKNPPEDHAARLVESAGAKGMAVGGAVVSDKHANFIVARPGATANDVARLIEQVAELVRERFGVSLEPEVKRVGDFDVASR
jgi:UDP-N-acetylmuramate dehydrogenase